MALAKRKARPEPLVVAAKQLTPSAGHHSTRSSKAQPRDPRAVSYDPRESMSRAGSAQADGSAGRAIPAPRTPGRTGLARRRPAALRAPTRWPGTLRRPRTRRTGRTRPPGETRIE